MHHQLVVGPNAHTRVKNVQPRLAFSVKAIQPGSRFHARHRGPPDHQLQRVAAAKNVRGFGCVITVPHANEPVRLDVSRQLFSRHYGQQLPSRRQAAVGSEYVFEIHDTYIRGKAARRNTGARLSVDKSTLVRTTSRR